MKTIQKNLLKMGRTVRNKVNEFGQSWEGDQGIIDALPTFDKFLEDIRINLDIQLVDIKTITKVKEQMHLAFADKTDIILSNIRSYADWAKNEELFGQAKYSQTELITMSDDELYSLSDNVISICKKYPNELKPFDIDEKTVEDYGKEAKAYLNYCDKPRRAIVARSQATQRLSELFPVFSHFLSHTMDTNVIRYRVKDLKFYTEYFNTRIIVDAPVRKNSVLGNITEENTHLLLKNVLVKFVFVPPPENPAAPVTEYTTTTTDKGNFRFKSLPQGEYTVTFSLFGHDTLTKQVYVYANQQLKLNEQLRVTE